MGKKIALDVFRNLIFVTEGSCEWLMDDRALLIISIMAKKWFRKILFVFNLTGVMFYNNLYYFSGYFVSKQQNLNY